MMVTPITMIRQVNQNSNINIYIRVKEYTDKVTLGIFQSMKNNSSDKMCYRY